MKCGPGAPLTAMPLLESVERYRREYEASRAHLLIAPASEMPSAARYAFVSHRQLAAVEAAEQRDAAAMQYFRGPESAVDLERSAIRTRCGAKIVVRAWDGVREELGRYGEMPARPVGSLPERIDPSLVRLLLRASDMCDEAGFGNLLLNGCAVVVLLRPRRLEEVTSSWTTSALPCTVFCDYHMDPALLGADVVHETTHNLLNDILRAREVEFPDEERYFSPWKSRLRPAFGFLHSVVAFSIVVQYLRRAGGLCVSAEAKAYAAQREQIESGRLRLIGRSVQTLLRESLCEDRELAEAVAQAYASAVA